MRAVWVVVLWGCCCCCCCLGSPQEYFVSTTGNDSHPGTKDEPFATLERARDAIRDLHSLPPGGVIVTVRGGTYASSDIRTATPTPLLQLSATDSGTATNPILYRAYPGERVELVGGIQVPSSSFVPYQGKVLKADLGKLGLQHFGSLGSGGLNDCKNQKSQLYVNGEAQVLARWPNINPADGMWEWAHVQKVVDSLAFTYNGSRQDEWGKESDGWMHGYWKYGWADNYIKIGKVLTNNKTIQVDATTPPLYSLQDKARYYGVNLLCELDVPGEYYIDRAAKVLYLYPAVSITNANVWLSLAPHLITMSATGHPVTENSGFAGGWEVPVLRATPPSSYHDDVAAVDPEGRWVVGSYLSPSATEGSNGTVEFVTISGIDLLYTIDTPFIATNVNNVTLRSARVHNHAQHAIVVSGYRNVVDQCDVASIGCWAVSVTGGYRPTLIPGNNVASGNFIRLPAQWKRTYQPGLFWAGIGNTYTGNTVYMSPHNGFLGGGNEGDGNDCLFEFNNISHVAYEVSDSGGFYTCGQQGQGWIARGNVIRHNHFEYVRNTEKIVLGYPSVQAIYLDDQTSGYYIHDNTFLNCQKGAFVGGGRRNIVQSNRFDHCDVAVHIDNRGMNWQKSSCEPPNGILWKGLESVNYTKPPWSTRWPELLTIAKDHPCVPVHNEVQNNVYCGGKFQDFTDAQAKAWFDIVNNNTQHC